jgi:hypothetical protein
MHQIHLDKLFLFSDAPAENFENPKYQMLRAGGKHKQG